MSKALQMGLLGAAGGLMQGALTLAQEAKTERLRQARMLEEKMLAEQETRAKLAITPPHEKTTEKYDEQGNRVQVTEQWNVDASGPMEQWKGEYSETSRVNAPKKFKEVERKVGDKIVTVRQYEDGSEEQIADAPRYRPGGEGGDNYKPQLFRPANGDGRPIWVKPGEPVPDGYIPSNAPRTAENAHQKLISEIGKEVRKLGEEDLRAELNRYDIEAGPGKRLAEARADLIRAKVAEETQLRGLGGAAPKPAEKEPAAPMPGARQAPDGNWYVQQNGRWFRVDG